MDGRGPRARSARRRHGSGVARASPGQGTGRQEPHRPCGALIEPDLGRGGTSSIGVGVELNELALSIGAAPPIRSVRVTGASDDSRTVRPGDLYVALPGRRAHGLDFELEAKARGAVAALSDRASTVLPTLVVPNPRRRVGEVCARIHRFAHRDLDLYGVTGTNGKTSTTLLLGAGLAAAGDSVATMTGIGLAGPRGAEESARTTPEAATVHRTLRRFRDEGATAVALEVSSHAVTEHRVDGLRFAVMGFLNLTQDHWITTETWTVTSPRRPNCSRRTDRHALWSTSAIRTAKSWLDASIFPVGRGPRPIAMPMFAARTSSAPTSERP
ncbi:MAG: hypothetical protein EOP29_06030 [Rhodococcus sp. (in: high G+C Gram-positive bacteria)]|nr:MAG: hypothetical protein EOP29_06030 [Rhodococcus sp. (in: high G+C Gram-positive bacteria)]